MALVIKAGSTTLPAEVVEIKRGDEILWSDGTGRSASSGLMVGTVVATKQTWALRWGVITQAEYDVIRSIPTGFFALSVKEGSTTLASLTCYRSNVSGSYMGIVGGTGYWRDVEVEMIEQ